jgi:hemolysin-activating ACP:hemolysin acyltransferase
MNNMPIQRDEYMEIMRFLMSRYGYLSDWICKRNLMCMAVNQVFVVRNKAGQVVTYVAWWLVDKESLAAVQSKRFVPEDASAGNAIWVIDGASVEIGGIAAARRYLRKLYADRPDIKGISWLRDDRRLVESLRQRGKDYEMVS